MSANTIATACSSFCGTDLDFWDCTGPCTAHAPEGLVVLLCRLVQQTAARNNQQETLAAEKATCDQHRAAIAELAEDALAAKVGA